MKNSIRLAFIGLMAISIAGCDDSQVTNELAVHDKSNKVIYSLTLNDGNFEVEPITLETSKASVHSKEIQTRNPNSSASGIYNFPEFFVGEGESLTFTFTAMENNGGVHGSSHVVGTEGTGLLDVKIASDCILVNGDKAYWGGVITRWVVTQDLQDFFDFVVGGPYTGFGVGHQMYWSAQDNGEGGNSTGPDAGGDAYIIIPEGEDAEENGFESWCHFTELDYGGAFHPFTHGYIPGVVPSNVQVQ